MTALYAILAIICISGILVGAYLIGFDDGVKAEQMRMKNLAIISIMEDIKANHHDGNDYPQQEQEQRHAMTHADIAQLEQEAKNKNEV